MRSIPAQEQETIVRWSADEKVATASTANRTIIRKLDKLVEDAPNDYQKLANLTDAHDARYTMNVKLLRFGRPVSEARREAARRNGLSSGFKHGELAAANDLQ